MKLASYIINIQNACTQIMLYNQGNRKRKPFLQNQAEVIHFRNKLTRNKRFQWFPIVFRIKDKVPVSSSTFLRTQYTPVTQFFF